MTGPRRASALAAVLALLTGCGLTPPPTRGVAPSAVAPSSAVVTAPTASATPSAPTADCLGPASPPAGAAALPAAVSSVQAGGVRVAVAYLAPSGVVHLGTLGVTAAWSTAKVPLSFAVVQAGLGEKEAANLESALRLSDNDAADALWHSLGTDAEASAKVAAVLRQAGDDATSVPTTVSYSPYSILGQTQWSVDAQVGFMRRAACLDGSATVLAEMAQVDVGQRWGLGALPGAVFKGGWGPPKVGGYEARQFGSYESPAGRVYVALAARASTFARATAALDTLTRALES